MRANELSKILIYDENVFTEKLLRNLLQAFEISTIDTCHTTPEAITLLKEGDVDCIIMDWAKGEGSDLELVKMIRSGKYCRYDMPIVLCTSQNRKADVLKARDSGVSEIIIKPIEADHLLAKLVAAYFDARPYIDVKTYKGPDRRRKSSDDYTGPERRGRAGLKQDGADSIMKADA